MNKIILVDNIELEVRELEDKFDAEFSRYFVLDDFKMDDANDVIAEAYISSHKTKTLILAANFYNLFAQNALLKILEEPPKNIEFILIGKNKNTFLSTVRSRLVIEDKRTKQYMQKFDLDLKQLNLQNIYQYLKQEHENSFEYAKQKIESLLYSLSESDIELSEDELLSFDEAILASLNHQRFNYVMLPLLLMILDRKHKKR